MNSATTEDSRIVEHSKAIRSDDESFIGLDPVAERLKSMLGNFGIQGREAVIERTVKDPVSRQELFRIITADFSNEEHRRILSEIVDDLEGLYEKKKFTKRDELLDRIVLCKDLETFNNYQQAIMLRANLQKILEENLEDEQVVFRRVVTDPKESVPKEFAFTVNFSKQPGNRIICKNLAGILDVMCENPARYPYVGGLLDWVVQLKD